MLSSSQLLFVATDQHCSLQKITSIAYSSFWSRLRQILSCISVETGKLDIAYLKQRISHLPQIERIAVLIIDKAYTAQRIEYCNGQFIGLTKDGGALKTVLTFNVQSIYSKYKDVVCLIPINKLDTALLRECFF